MGGGHVSRPDFGMPQPDPAYPLTEFYLLAQQALEKSGSFYAARPLRRAALPARRIYREEAAGYLQLAAAPAEGLTRLLSPARMQLLYSSLQVQPDGTPRRPFADRGVYPPDRRGAAAAALFVSEDPLPPLPDVPAALTLQLTMQDVMAIDTSPAALAQKLVHSTDGKCWLHHPKARPFSPSGWRCCKGSINKEGAPSPLLLSAIPWYTDR